MKSLKLLTDKQIAQDFLLDILGKKINITHTGYDFLRRLVDIYGALEDGSTFLVRITEAEDDEELHLSQLLMFDAYARAYDTTGIFHQVKSIVFLKYDNENWDKSIGLKDDWNFQSEGSNIRPFENLISLTTIQCHNQDKYRKLESEREIYEWTIFFNNPLDDKIQNIIQENKHIRYAYNKYIELIKKSTTSK